MVLFEMFQARFNKRSRKSLGIFHSIADGISEVRQDNDTTKAWGFEEIYCCLSFLLHLQNRSTYVSKIIYYIFALFLKDHNE